MSDFENHPLYPGEGAPTFIAAGVLKEPGQLQPFLDHPRPEELPVLTIGSLVNPSAGNATTQHPVDFIYYSDLRMAGNARGLPGNGIDGIKALQEPIRELMARGVKVNVSVSNLLHETPIDVVPELVDQVATVLEPTTIEVNLSCPNGKKDDGSLHPPLCNDADASGEVMQAAYERLNGAIMLGAKDSPHVTSLEAPMDESAVRRLVRVIRPYIGFMVGINTIGNQDFPEITSTGGKGGMSGPIVAPIAKRHLRIIRDEVHDMAYLSCGGVDAENAGTEIAERLALGAMLVGGAQQFYRSNPIKVIERWHQAYLLSK